MSTNRTELSWNKVFDKNKNKQNKKMNKSRFCCLPVSYLGDVFRLKIIGKPLERLKSTFTQRCERSMRMGRPFCLRGILIIDALPASIMTSFRL